MLNKKIALGVIITAFSSLSFAANATEATLEQKKLEVTNDQHRWVPGDSWLKQGEGEYAQGKFNDYLKSIDSLFDQPEAQQQLRAVEKSYQDYLAQEKQMKTVLEDFKTKANALKDERNKQLKEACKGGESEEVCKVVQSVVAIDSSNLDDLFHDPIEDMNDPLKKDLDNLQLEWMLRLQIAEQMAQKSGQAIDQDQLDKQLLAIHLSFIDKLKAFAAAHPNTPAGTYASTIVAKLPARIALTRNLSYISTIGKDNNPAKNPTEEKIAKIMDEYYNKIGELTKATFQQPGAATK